MFIKQYFRPYIRRYTSPNEKFEYSYPLNLITVLKMTDFQVTVNDCDILNVFLIDCGYSLELHQCGDPMSTCMFLY